MTIDAVPATMVVSGGGILTPADQIPDAFTFTDQTGVSLSNPTITSNSITVAGINAPTSISVSGDPTSTYSINGGAYTSVSSTVEVNDTVTVRHTSAAQNSTNTDTVLTIGTVSDTFTSTTVAAASGDAALFFVSAHTLPPNAYLTIYGYNLQNVSGVQVNGKSQTIINTAYDYDHLPIHPALMKLGKDTSVYNINLTVDGDNEPTNTEKYQKIDVQLDNVVVGDTQLTLSGCGLITNADGTYDLTDTLTDFTIHSGNNYFVSQAGNDITGDGSIGSPWRTLGNARIQMSAGDCVYVRGALDWDDIDSDGAAIWLPTDFGEGDTLPRYFGTYPGETVRFNANTVSNLVGYESVGGGDNLPGPLTIHGFEFVRASPYGGTVLGGVFNGVSLRDQRYVAIYGQGQYNGSGAAQGSLGGKGSSLSDPLSSNNVYTIGWYMDLTSENDLSQGMVHVYYHGGRGYSQNVWWAHCRSTRHGLGRVCQYYGHSDGSEFITETGFSFCNLEGRKQDAGAKPSVLRWAGWDPPPGNASWYDKIYARWNSISGGSQGIHMLGRAGQDACDAQGAPDADLDCGNNVCYNNSDDIAMYCYETVNVYNNITQDAPSFYIEQPNGTTTISTNNQQTYPQALQ